MWLTEQDVSHAWGSFKGIMGQAWSHGHKFLNTIDRFANVGGRLLGAGASTGLLQGRALESGMRAANEYSKARGQVLDYGRNVERTVGHFRQAVPELNL